MRILAINAAVVVSNLYDYAKQNSGPIKSTVGKVENAVAAVVGPVYERFKSVPADILVFLDEKVNLISFFSFFIDAFVAGLAGCVAFVNLFFDCLKAMWTFHVSFGRIFVSFHDS